MAFGVATRPAHCKHAPSDRYRFLCLMTIRAIVWLWPDTSWYAKTYWKEKRLKKITNNRSPTRIMMMDTREEAGIHGEKERFRVVLGTVWSSSSHPRHPYSTAARALCSCDSAISVYFEILAKIQNLCHQSIIIRIKS